LATSKKGIIQRRKVNPARQKNVVTLANVSVLCGRDKPTVGGRRAKQVLGRGKTRNYGVAFGEQRK